MSKDTNELVLLPARRGRSGEVVALLAELLLDAAAEARRGRFWRRFGRRLRQRFRRRRPVSAGAPDAAPGRAIGALLELRQREGR